METLKIIIRILELYDNNELLVTAKWNKNKVHYCLNYKSTFQEVYEVINNWNYDNLKFDVILNEKQIKKLFIK